MKRTRPVQFYTNFKITKSITFQEKDFQYQLLKRYFLYAITSHSDGDELMFFG